MPGRTTARDQLAKFVYVSVLQRVVSTHLACMGVRLEPCEWRAFCGEAGRIEIFWHPSV